MFKSIVYFSLLILTSCNQGKRSEPLEQKAKTEIIEHSKTKFKPCDLGCIIKSDSNCKNLRFTMSNNLGYFHKNEFKDFQEIGKKTSFVHSRQTIDVNNTCCSNSQIIIINDRIKIATDSFSLLQIFDNDSAENLLFNFTINGRSVKRYIDTTDGYLGLKTTFPIYLQEANFYKYKNDFLVFSFYPMSWDSEDAGKNAKVFVFINTKSYSVYEFYDIGNLYNSLRD